VPFNENNGTGLNRSALNFFAPWFGLVPMNWPPRRGGSMIKKSHEKMEYQAERMRAQIASSTGLYSKSLKHIYVGFCAVTLFAIIVSAWALIHLRSEAEGRVILTTKSLAVSVEQSIEGKLDTIDMALLASVDEIRRQMENGKPDRKSVTQFLIQQQKRVPHLDLLRATDEKGVTIYGDGVPFPATAASSIADRDYFPQLRDKPNPGLVIAKPIIGKLSQKWIWLFARRIDKPDGTFGGVVYGSIFIDELRKVLSQVKMGRNSVIALRDTNMETVARDTFGSQELIQIGDKRLSTPAREAIEINQNEGTFLSDTSSIDGFSRWYAYQRSPRYGFTVFVGVPLDFVLSEWKLQAEFVLTILVLFIFSAIVYVRNARREWLSQIRDTENLSRLHKELIQQELQVRQLAFYDPLTSLPNRRLLSDRLSQAMSTSKRSGNYCALLFLDLDNFKPLNDTHGHRVGDLLLVEVADRIRSCVREIDTVARLGGDEFVVVIGEISDDKPQSIKQASAVGEKILFSLAQPYQLKVQHPGEEKVVVEHICSVSIGVALFLNHEVSGKDLIACADNAMYQAKLAGRNAIRFWE
jgi:diguanylate cyclase (GGDEF)-like protein